MALWFSLLSRYLLGQLARGAELLEHRFRCLRALLVLPRRVGARPGGFAGAALAGAAAGAGWLGFACVNRVRVRGGRGARTKERSSLEESLLTKWSSATARILRTWRGAKRDGKSRPIRRAWRPWPLPTKHYALLGRGRAVVERFSVSKIRRKLC